MSVKTTFQIAEDGSLDARVLRGFRDGKWRWGMVGKRWVSKDKAEAVLIQVRRDHESARLQECWR